MPRKSLRTAAAKAKAVKKTTTTKAKPTRKSKSPLKAASSPPPQANLCPLKHANNDPYSKLAANKIAKYLSEQEGCDVNVEINKEKPGRGNFVVRVEGKEEPVLELLGMKRPFKDLKALEMEDVGKMVIEALGEEADEK
eukprot:CAMPEP_0201610998 /NCGR_PEP_ID=MMETSP0492-20130828/18738_1 /ASSEMBLY_ACC=CAM_ASM_000837 /TAXON_ID=420259 /ORGANISM="Thalassiosira gravida, Strain GMp14c1" /LENGTH=138 /DNA_ID=CAMNT_0048077023 /DNA_START=37 /DNA_END=453 /DNA_ORIENTATION=-